MGSNGVFSELAFPDPRGSNHRELEKALQQAAKHIAEYLAGIATQRLQNHLPIFQDPLPLDPLPFSDALAQVFTRVTSSAMHVSHPGYMAHMDSAVTTAGIVGDFVASALNQNMLAQEIAPGATAIENQVVQWFCKAAGLPATSGGTFVSGGSMANLTALLAARDRSHPEISQKGLSASAPMCVFASVDAHFSIQKATAVLGLGSQAVVPIATDSQHRMLSADLQQKIAQARQAKILPLAIIGTAGTTSTGAIDPLEDLGQIAQQNNIWFHVDAAYGGALLFSEKLRHLLKGLELADSIALDPHKWLWIPKNAGLILMRNYDSFYPANYKAPYLDRKNHAHDLGRKSIAGSRRFDALKVWLTLRHLGTRKLGSLMERNVELTQYLYQRIGTLPKWRCLMAPNLNILCFYPISGKDLEQEIYQPLLQDGRFWVSLTKVGEQEVLRTVMLNPSIDKGILDALTERLTDF